MKKMHSNVEDLTQLKVLDSSSVIRCLHARYKKNSFYTWAGPTLVALNPQREMPEVYSRNVMQLFAHETFTYTNPHIFALGQRSLRHLQWGIGKTHQAIVVNGESGAGKTCSALYLLSYLAAMESNNNEIVSSSEDIEVLLCQSNPLLEALGNAQTLRNENSSRFGKLIRLLYTGEGSGTELVSAHIETYLLESTRVALQASGERNFHIFYQMLAGLSNQSKAQLGLENTNNWSITNGSCNSNDATDFVLTVKALEQLNLSDVVNDLWRLLGAILHLGNLTFIPSGKDWTVEQEVHHHLEWGARLLGLGATELLEAITVKNFQAGSNSPVLLKPCSSQAECSARRDTFIRLLYRLLFSLVLDRINEKLRYNESPAKCKYLCILDLYGFESFEHGNSLEQLCINYANERLQHYFTVHYLKEQQTHLANEGLTSINLEVNVTDKQNLISFLDGAVSVFGVLNEECYLNRGCDDSQVCMRIQSSLMERTRGTKSMPPSPRLARASGGNNNNNILTGSVRKPPQLQFAICHYAGLVTYSTVAMLDKNRDHVPSELVSLLAQSASPFVRLLVGKELTALNTTHTMFGRRHTVLAKFKNSLDSLMKILNTCDVHYVRCIRPSGSSHPSKWDEDYVESQLNACGVIDTIKVSSFGFPIRMSHEEFASRYHFFTMAVSGERPDAVEMCRRIVNIHGKMGEEIRVGQSQVYATEQGIELVERWKHRVRNQAAVLIQQWWRELVRRRAAAILLQDWWRSVRRSRAATRLQNWWRIKFYRKRTLHKVAKISRSVLVIQRSVRRWIQSRKKPLPSTNTHLHLAEETPPPSPLPPETTATTKICLRISPQRTVIRPLSLHLSRSDWFYSDGIVSIRRPAAELIRFVTRKTCLPYSYIVPLSQLPKGLTDALL